MNLWRSLTLAIVVLVVGVSVTRPAEEPKPDEDRAAKVEKELRQLIASLQDQVTTLSLHVAQLEQQSPYVRPALRTAPVARPAVQHPNAWKRGEINGHVYYISPLAAQ
ncbi:MAG TPA: hypothetical protein VHV77_09150 [Pirellulales bacterium]|jgi:uncharacterized protein YlxW (UPF0749 family)|nr:hypothetical protein [Pirellulales bacterium]